jgi:hypothetical protein
VLVRLAVLIVALFTLVAAPPAEAGTYDVYSCRFPDGRPAPADGWTPFGAIAHDTCSRGGGLTADLPAERTLWERVSGWRFSAPADTSIRGFTIYRYAESESAWPWGRDYTSFYDNANPRGLGPANPDYCFSHFAGCTSAGVKGSFYTSDNKVERGSLDIHTLSFEVVCWGYGEEGVGYCEPGTRTPGRLNLFAARFSLRDDFAPSLAAGTGSLEDGQVISSPTQLVVDAADRGSGLTRWWLEADGVVQPDSVVAAGGDCAVPYTKTVPCPRRAAIAVPIDPEALGDGPRTLRVGVTDAAGNTTKSGEIRVVVARPAVSANAGVAGLPNGQGATRFAQLRCWFAGKSRVAVKRVRYGATARIAGRLTTQAGAPIAGARLSVTARIAGSSRSPRLAAVITTDAQGGFTYRVARGPGRSFDFAYTAFSTDAGSVAHATAKLKVRAGVRLRTSTSRVTRGRASASRVACWAGRPLDARSSRSMRWRLARAAGSPWKRFAPASMEGSLTPTGSRGSWARASTGSRRGSPNRPGFRTWRARRIPSPFAVGRDRRSNLLSRGIMDAVGESLIGSAGHGSTFQRRRGGAVGGMFGGRVAGFRRDV